MPIRAARQALTRAGATRAGRCIGLAALALLLGNKGLQNAVAEGDTRTISLHHIHTGEDLTVTYKRDGRYDEDALKKVNHLLRDWRRNEEIKMDPRLLDVVWEVYREVDAKAPIQVVCGFRSPATNAMLRRRSRGVAEYSQHMLGHAMDFFIPGVPLETQREAGLRLQRGGVGYYPSSGSPFVHMDVGSVRHWPRMTHDQLARVFPNGRTVHVPSDGHPLAGYALALADIKKRGSSEPSAMSLEAARSAGVDVAEPPRRNLFAALFASKDEEEDNEIAAAPSPQPARATDSRTADRFAQAKAAAPKPADAKPATPTMARSTTRNPPEVAADSARGGSFNLASAESQPAQLGVSARRAPEDARASSATTDLFADRGYWDQPAAARETTGAMAAWPVKAAQSADRAPPGLALAYAAQAGARQAPAAAVTRGIAAGSAMPRQDAATQFRVATAAQPVATPSARGAATAPVVKAGLPLDDLWVRALFLAPNLRRFMTATLLGQPDMRELQPLMEKPDTVVTMGFGVDPMPGLTTERFTGNAVVFVATTTFARRTAALP